MRYELSVDINADAARVWAVLTDVEHWPEWTASVRRVQRLESGPLRLGSRTRVDQPRMRPLVWEVTGLEPDRDLTWTSRTAGVTTVASHRLAAHPDGTVTMTLGVEQSGALAPLVGLLAGGQTRRYVQLEAQGAKRRSESG